MIDGEPGAVRYVLTEISAHQVAAMMRAFPTSVLAEVTGIAQEHWQRAAGMSEATIAYVAGYGASDPGQPAGCQEEPKEGTS